MFKRRRCGRTGGGRGGGFEDEEDTCWHLYLLNRCCPAGNWQKLLKKTFCCSKFIGGVRPLPTPLNPSLIPLILIPKLIPYWGIIEQLTDNNFFVYSTWVWYGYLNTKNSGITGFTIELIKSWFGDYNQIHPFLS